jgi:uncharacterized repeat protein (TIGR01451 family)
MLMHDPAHSGHTAATLDTTDELYLQWKFSFGERVEVEVQPVVANGRVYVGVMNGKMYCLDALSGAQEWVYHAGGPIPHTAAVASGRVYFGALDGRVYALDALNGEVAWTYQTDGPIYSAPAAVDGTVFIGSLDGYLYALDADNGHLQWRYRTDGQVNTSPATGDGLVYFGSEDMHAYAVRASDGQLVWKRPLSGYGMRNTYPVLAPEANTVIFVTIKPGASSNVHMEGYPEAPEGSDFRTTWQQYYTAHPARRHLFYLDADTGEDKWGGGLYHQSLPLSYWGLLIPVMDGAGNAWFPVASGVEGYKSTLDHDYRLVKVDLDTGLAVQVAHIADVQFSVAEVGRPTMIDDKYFYTVSEDAGAYDPAANTRQALFGNSFWSHMAPLDPLPTKHLWRYGGVIAMGGVPNASPLVAAGGLGYYVSYGWLYCIGPEERTPPQVAPRSDLAEPYWPSGITAAEAQAELVSQVAQIIAAGHLSPTARFVQAGYGAGLNRGYARPFQAFWFEGELVRTLAETLPFLPLALQSETRDYLYTEAEANLFNLSGQRSLAYDEGLQTYWYAHNENLMAERWYAAWAYAYYTGDWTLVEANWTSIKDLFIDRFVSTFSEDVGFCQFLGWRTGHLLDLNQQIGGMLGVSRMAAHMGDTAVETQATYMLERMYTARVEMGHYVQNLYDSGELERVEIRLEPDGRINHDDLMTYYNNPCETIPYREYRDRDSDIRQVVWWGDGGDDILYYSGLGGSDHYAVIVGYVPMYPEVADLLRTHLLAESQEYVNTYVMNDPWWWLNDLSHSKVGNAESLYEGPALSFSIFQTKAYVLQESFEELSRQLPLPYANVGHRDLYRLQNLIALLRALPQASKSVSATTVDGGDVLTYTIFLQGTGTTGSITDTIPAGTTYVPYSAQVEPQVGALTAGSDLIHWTGVLTEYTSLELTFAVTVTVTEPCAIVNTAIVDNGEESHEFTAITIANGFKVYLPLVLKS